MLVSYLTKKLEPMADQPNDFPKKTPTSPWTIRILIVALVVVGFMGWEKAKSRNIVAIYHGSAVIQVSQSMEANILDSRDQASMSGHKLLNKGVS